MDTALTRVQIIAQWLTLVDADVVDSVGVVAIVEGDEDAVAVAVERTRRRNGMQIALSLYRPRILTRDIEGLPSQNLAAL